MQDSTTRWARYIEDLETQAARLPRRRGPEPPRPGLLAAIRAGAARLVARLRRARVRSRPEIDG
jgi:hypothetical protein